MNTKKVSRLWFGKNYPVEVRELVAHKKNTKKEMADDDPLTDT